ncbi:FG-GAP repeat protein [Runella slithyformis]|uniref:FG-GAP repeat protein n=1 Tax=Runella slithyformis (strain ATCC 29530 / DSM 19594 / LMG 11500 / NCIMB 11436 / LSU 4) TaxID=761193 RepID=A0A7U3ZK53_RUNSL|nr:FG-GAP repeat protein [Runella slithyformis]AEI48666.1 FG-GAP repeat protein [Runella slithyformis DSM 19594]
MKLITIFLACLFCFYQQKTSTDTPIKIYFSGSTYYEEDLPENHQTIQFIGVFDENSVYAIKPTNIATDKVEDFCDSGDTQIRALNGDNCRLLIHNKNVKSHKFLGLSINNSQAIAPAFNKSFYYMGETYTITATGYKKTSPKWEKDYYETTNYKLYISTVRNGKPIKQLLCAVKKFEERLPASVVVAGDIDGDGLLDMLVEAGQYMGGAKYYLFLSSHAKPGEVFHSVAFAEFLSC